MSHSGKYEDSVKNKLESNKDLHFLHDLYKRLRVLALMNRYTMNELEEYLSHNDDDDKYVKNTREENKKKFKGERFNEKYKISLSYYIMETNRFEELYNKRKDESIEGFSKISSWQADNEDALFSLFSFSSSECDPL